MSSQTHHSGWRFPWIANYDEQPDFHDYHHAKFNCNFGEGATRDKRAAHAARRSPPSLFRPISPCPPLIPIVALLHPIHPPQPTPPHPLPGVTGWLDALHGTDAKSWRAARAAAECAKRAVVDGANQRHGAKAQALNGVASAKENDGAKLLNGAKYGAVHM